MGKGRASKRILAVAAVTASIAALGGAAPAQASESAIPPPCDNPLLEPLCDMAKRQVEHAVTEAGAAAAYVFFLGDKAVTEAVEAYNTVKCAVVPCP